MTSRKRKTKVSDDDSDYADASPVQKKPRKTATHKKAGARAKGRKRGGIPDASAYVNEEDVELTEVANAIPHTMELHVLSSPESPRQALLKWYDGVHAVRGMPWRKPYQDSWTTEEKAQRAYEVWVSEIMLQQTQVATVIPYYNRWMERFPTIRDLAASDIDTVNGLWKGLGYYSRAARLLSGAQKAVKEYGGRLPDNAQDMESNIPGIGRYSAGAICSIAYNQCVPVLDGNVHRLLSRMLALHAPPKAKQTLDVLWAGASAFVKDAERPGDVNQALIELGSTVCKVRDPDCRSCPLQPWCVAYGRQRQRKRDKGKEDEKLRTGPCNQGAKVATSPAGHAIPDIEELCTLCEPLPEGSPVTAYPMKAEKKRAREELDVVNVIEWRKHAASEERWFLLVRRPEGGLLAGLHEFPTAPNVPESSSSPSTAHVELASSLLSALLVTPPSAQSTAAVTSRGQAARRSTSQSSAERPGSLRVAKVVPAGDVLHIFSHIRKTYRVQWVVLEGGTSETPPSLVPAPDFASFGAAMPKTSKGKKTSGKKRAAGPDEDDDTRGTSSSSATAPSSAPAAQWVRLEAVADANIGTGVMKVWRQVCALWAGGEDEDPSGSEDGVEQE
ncbi:DNA glycosylase [Cubamyces lactineus]|nr:DNA glycosylase [Cubamyces lactineus]